MSIALMNRIKETEAELARLKNFSQEASYQIALLQQRLAALENRPKPGRPPKHG